MGRLLGHRFLELTYGGRTSRKVRRVLLEVARYDAAQRESVVVAAWGDRTEWYRNLLAEPALMAETGGHRFRPIQRVLSPAETYDVMRDYVGRHTWATPIARRLFGLRFDDGARDRQELGKLRAVGLSEPILRDSAGTPR